MRWGRTPRGHGCASEPSPQLGWSSAVGGPGTCTGREVGGRSHAIAVAACAHAINVRHCLRRRCVCDEGTGLCAVRVWCSVRATWMKAEGKGWGCGARCCTSGGHGHSREGRRRVKTQRWPSLAAPVGPAARAASPAHRATATCRTCLQQETTARERQLDKWVTSIESCRSAAHGKTHKSRAFGDESEASALLHSSRPAPALSQAILRGHFRHESRNAPLFVHIHFLHPTRVHHYSHVRYRDRCLRSITMGQRTTPKNE